MTHLLLPHQTSLLADLGRSIPLMMLKYLEGYSIQWDNQVQSQCPSGQEGIVKDCNEIYGEGRP